MFRRKCVCGATEKNFKKDIGPFFVDECCEKAGYDHFGKKQEDYDAEGEDLANQFLNDGEDQSESENMDMSSDDAEGEDIQESSDEESEKGQDAQIELSVEFLESITAKEIMAKFDEAKIEYKKRDTKTKLIERFKALKA